MWRLARCLHVMEVRDPACNGDAAGARDEGGYVGFLVCGARMQSLNGWRGRTMRSIILGAVLQVHGGLWMSRRLWGFLVLCAKVAVE